MGTHETALKIYNDTDYRWYIEVCDIDEFDWNCGRICPPECANRPDINLHGKFIGPQSSLLVQEDINTSASCVMYTLIFHKISLTTQKGFIRVRVDQKLAGALTSCPIIKEASIDNENIVVKHFHPPYEVDGYRYGLVMSIGVKK